MTTTRPLARSRAHDRAKPVLSVLTPTYRWAPLPILEALEALPKGVMERIEWIVLDDGSEDPATWAALAQAVAASPVPAAALAFENNAGRAKARNHLINQARGEFVLFLDADMVPHCEAFFTRWLALIDTVRPPLAFGGFTAPEATGPATALHRYLSERSDCRPAATRRRDPAQFCATSNLLVRRDVLDATCFDDAFIGWGFEDVDFALRASRFGQPLHIDNPALHTGLDTPEALLRKFAQAGPNYARLALKHPEAVKRFVSWRVARLLRRSPGHRGLRPLLAWLARDPMGVMPMVARYGALKLYRASIFAEHVP